VGEPLTWGREKQEYELFKGKHTGQVGPDKNLQTSLNDIERKAKYNKNHKFENLYGLLNKWNLGQSWKYINTSAYQELIE